MIETIKSVEFPNESGPNFYHNDSSFADQRTFGKSGKEPKRTFFKHNWIKLNCRKKMVVETIAKDPTKSRTKWMWRWLNRGKYGCHFSYHFLWIFEISDLFISFKVHHNWMMTWNEKLFCCYQLSSHMFLNVLLLSKQNKCGQHFESYHFLIFMVIQIPNSAGRVCTLNMWNVMKLCHQHFFSCLCVYATYG